MTAKILKHAFQSTIADASDTTLVRPQSGWNADHNFTLGYRYVTTTPDTITSSDTWSGITYVSSSTIAATLNSTTLTGGFVTFIKNNGTASVTLTPNSGLINSATTTNLAPGAGVMLWCDGSNYYSITSYDISSAGYSGTSPTSVAISTGSQSFTASLGRLWAAGVQLIISSDADPTNYMHGAVTSYSPVTGALVVDVIDTGGSGTYSDWNIVLSGTRGPAGPNTSVNIRISTSASVTLTASDEIVVLNQTASGAITVALPSVSLADVVRKEIYRFDGNSGDITITPDGAETIMGLPSWTVSSLGVTGGGGSIELFPMSSLSGWVVR